MGASDGPGKSILVTESRMPAGPVWVLDPFFPLRVFWHSPEFRSISKAKKTRMILIAKYLISSSIV